MYICSICFGCSKPGQSRKVWVVERIIPHTTRDGDGHAIESTRTEIDIEIPVCHRCYKELGAGVEMLELKSRYRVNPGPIKLDEWPEDVGRKW